MTKSKKNPTIDKATKYLPSDLPKSSDNEGICIIEGCSNAGTNPIGIVDETQNIIPCFACDRHYKELMERYFEKSAKKQNKALTL